MTKQELVFLILQDVRLGNLSEAEALSGLQELGMVIKVKNVAGHTSDCAVHSEPAYPKGECDCGSLFTVEPLVKEVSNGQGLSQNIH